MPSRYHHVKLAEDSLVEGKHDNRHATRNRRNDRGGTRHTEEVRKGTNEAQTDETRDSDMLLRDSWY